MLAPRAQPNPRIPVNTSTLIQSKVTSAMELNESGHGTLLKVAIDSVICKKDTRIFSIPANALALFICFLCVAESTGLCFRRKYTKIDILSLQKIKQNTNNTKKATRTFGPPLHRSHVRSPSVTKSFFSSQARHRGPARPTLQLAVLLCTVPWHWTGGVSTPHVVPINDGRHLLGEDRHGVGVVG